MALRTLPFATSLTQANLIDHSAFVRMDIGGAIGIKRFTDRSTGASGTYVGNIDGGITSVTVTNGGTGYGTPPTVTFSAPPAGGVRATGTATVSGGAVISVTVVEPGIGYVSAPTISFGGPGTGAAASTSLTQTWTETGMFLGPMNQGQNDILSVSWLRFMNIDNPPTWTTWANTPGLKNAPVYVWNAWFDSAGVFAGAINIYQGKIANQELGDLAMLALKPFATRWAREVPWVTAKNLGAASIMPVQNAPPIQWGDFLRET